MSEASVKHRAKSAITDTVTGEGYVDYMYLDTKSMVTIGYGAMLPDEEAAAELEMVDADGNAATEKQKKDEWKRLRALSPAKCEINYAPPHYEDDAELFISRSSAEEFVDDKIDETVRMLRRHYKDFDQFPEDAQVAMIDMGYNLGNGIWKKFKHFTHEVNASKQVDWKKVARRCHRPDVNSQRNRLTKELFERAAEKKTPLHRIGPPAIP